MADANKAKMLISKMRDPEWLEASHTLLGALPQNQRELVACGIDPARRRRIFEKSPELLPQPLREQHMSEDDCSRLGGEVILAMPEDKRREFIERLLPGRAWCIESTLKILPRMAVPSGYYETRMIRAKDSASAAELQATWVGKIFGTLGPYRGSMPEIAGVLSHLDTEGTYEDFTQEWGWILAGAVESGTPEGEQTLRVMLECVRGEHETGGLTEHILLGLARCNRPEAWDCLAKLLLAAQRQEGLRAEILNVMEDAHPEAFLHLCRVILDHDLYRFSSVVQAANEWFGLRWDSASKKVVEEAFSLAVRFIESAKDRAAAVMSGSPTEAYFALWAAAFEELSVLIPLAEKAIASKNAEIRYAAVAVVSRFTLPELKPLLVRAIDDPDFRVATLAAEQFYHLSTEGTTVPTWRDAAFLAIERLMQRLPGKVVKLPVAVWPWTKRDFRTAELGAALVSTVGTETLPRLIPLLDLFSTQSRKGAAQLFSGLTWEERNKHGDGPLPATYVPFQISAVRRSALVSLIDDASAPVVEEALIGMTNRPFEPDEGDALAVALKRKNSQIRTAVLRRVLQFEDAQVLSFASRLLRKSAAEQRLAAFELLRSMAETKRSAEAAKQIAIAWAPAKGKPSAAETAAIALIGQAAIERPRREDAFGLINPDNLTKAEPARPLPQLCMSDAAWNCLAEIARIIAENKAMELPTDSDRRGLGGDEVILLSANRISYQVARPGSDLTIAEERARCPILDLVERWLMNRNPDTRDTDGLDLLRASLGIEMFSPGSRATEWINRPSWPDAIASRLKREAPDSLLVSKEPIQFFIGWAMRLAGDQRYGDALLDSLEGAIAKPLFVAAGSQEDEPKVHTWSGALSKVPLANFANGWAAVYRDCIGSGFFVPSPAQSVRYWHLVLAARPAASARWMQFPEADRGSRLDLWFPARIGVDPAGDLLSDALMAGGISEDDLLDHATHPYWGKASGNIHGLTNNVCEDNVYGEGEPSIRQKRQLQKLAADLHHPVRVSARRRLLERLLQLELDRGDVPTEASPMALAITNSGGAATCIRCIVGLGTTRIKRSPRYNDESRQGTLTHLISSSQPEDSDTPERFAAAAKAAALSEETLLTLGLFAPQWIRHVSHTLGPAWSGFDDAAWWIHGHTKDNDFHINFWYRRKWEAEIAERTPLTVDELGDGAVDVAWFTRARSALGDKRWAEIYTLAKYACSGVGHKRAQLFADAMMNKKGATERELMAKIKSKRHQDSIRALGLVPLKPGSAGQAQVLARFKLMAEIRRTSRKHGGSMLQASEKRAVEIGNENLARTAGYADPLRLQWAMEQLELGDLAKGPVVVKAGPVTVTLAVTDDGTPELTAEKAGKTLASVPAATKKEPKVAALAQRAADLRKSGSRMRQSLEQAMCRGDTFTAGELTNLLRHPVLRPMLERLMFIGDAASSTEKSKKPNVLPALAGYLDKAGKVLRDHAGALEPLKPTDTLRLAHPSDLLKGKLWHKWQRECFAAERVQPFKQVFRELYLPTEAEASQLECKRYEGHQVNPRQALALLGTRQWITRGEEGVQKTFYKERLTARLEFAEHFYTPAEVEGLTLRSISFTPAGKYEPIKLADVSPRVFSEAMRDLDLVVSVAHRAGVDPEASQSSMELRAALIKETATLLKLKDVSISASKVMIKGALAEYAVHLGSGMIHVLPGGQVWVVPIAAEHRGRLFLPFADSDPKTAEIVSKVLLLARDKEIQDMSILEQIRQFIS